MSRRTDADNAAWGQVIVAGDERRPIPVYSIARSTGVMHDKVLAMAGRYHVMKRVGIEPTGDWWHDRVSVKLPDPWPGSTSAQEEAAVAAA